MWNGRKKERIIELKEQRWKGKKEREEYGNIGGNKT
jgi:hypothetical protein